MPFIMIIFDMAISILFCQYYRKKNKTRQYRYDTMIAEVKKRILSERQYFPKKHPEKMIFSLLRGVLVQASPFNDNGS